MSSAMMGHDKCNVSMAHEADDKGARPAAEDQELNEDFIAAAISAYRRGDLDTIRRLGQTQFGPAADEPIARERAVPSLPPSAPRTLALDAPFVERGREALRALSAAAPHAAADEHLLHELVADEVAIFSAVTSVRMQVAARLPALVEEPRLMLLLTKSLRDLTALSNAIVRRVEGALGTCSTLRASRRLFSLEHGSRA